MTREIYGVTFNGKHSWKDYGLKWMAPFVIESPKEKRYSVEIPARNGKLDLTKFLTGDDVQYENRTMGFAFEYEGDYTKWDIVADKIENDLHGQLCGIIPDNRPDFVYYGVVTVNTKKETLESSCEIEILVDAEPYKYERYGSLEPWVWDTFCFEDGIIRDYRDLEVNGTMVLMSIEQYSALIDDVERKLDEADAFAANSSIRLSKSDVFDKIRSRVDEQAKL